jgi:hypothetical protein
VRRILVGAAVIGVMAALLASARSADAATWPAKCKTMACVNDRLNRLHNQDLKLARSVAGLNAFINQCLVVLPITQYGGYQAIDGVTEVAAVDFTATGDPVHLWAWGTDPGACGLPGSARPATARIHGLTLRTAVPRAAVRLLP